MSCAWVQNHSQNDGSHGTCEWSSPGWGLRGFLFSPRAGCLKSAVCGSVTAELTSGTIAEGSVSVEDSAVLADETPVWGVGREAPAPHGGSPPGSICAQTATRS